MIGSPDNEPKKEHDDGSFPGRPGAILAAKKGAAERMASGGLSLSYITHLLLWLSVKYFPNTLQSLDEGVLGRAPESPRGLKGT